MLWWSCRKKRKKRERDERESVFYMAYFESLDQLSDMCHQSSKKWERMGGEPDPINLAINLQMLKLILN
jgi:hypothetical protein